MLATSACTSIDLLEEHPSVITACQENVAILRIELAKCQWVKSTSVAENPVQIFVLAPNIIESRSMTLLEQERMLQECVDEVCPCMLMLSWLHS
jgi:serine palmitoyltransferase